ncbi:hypothetical protein HanPSC8_Chr14g0596281 [Helianthus annuus]|nr:hypothetical protein HanPSC8_Chr14g0596281 [Helianthus annuus]
MYFYNFSYNTLFDSTSDSTSVVCLLKACNLTLCFALRSWQLCSFQRRFIPLFISSLS